MEHFKAILEDVLGEFFISLIAKAMEKMRESMRLILSKESVNESVEKDLDIFINITIVKRYTGA